jgi:hypothetical protein
MSNSGPRRFSKPDGYDSRIHHLANKTGVNEPRSLLFARSRAARLNASFDEMLRMDRERLRTSTYPGPECLEPYEVEDYAVGSLSEDRVRHVETCSGCQVLVSGAVPSDTQVSAFLNDVRVTEPEPEALLAPRRVFWLDLVSVLAAAGATCSLGYAALRFVGPIASDSLIRTAALGHLAGWAGTLLATLSLGSLIAMAGFMLYRRELLVWSSGALASGVVVGLVAVFSGWAYLNHTAEALRTAVTLSQVQLTRDVAVSLGPYLLNNSSLELRNVHVTTTSSLMNVAASQPEPNRLEFRSDVKGVPGSVIADIGPDGGRLYWDVAKEKERVGTILFGTVESSTGDQFVLGTADGKTHTLKRRGGAPRLADGSDVLVLVDPKDDQAVVSMHSLTSEKSNIQ